jgi:hypothetical protein
VHGLNPSANPKIIPKKIIELSWESEICFPKTLNSILSTEVALILLSELKFPPTILLIEFSILLLFLLKMNFLLDTARG